MGFQEYIALRQRAMDEGWHHWQRIANSRDRIPAQEVHHCVAFEDPYDLDAPVKVLHPSPRFISELMAGGIHPPIEAVHAQMLRFECENCGTIEDTRLEAPAIHTKHKIKSEMVIDNSRSHLEAAMPMTYEQAFEYCVLKDIPYYVWNAKRNRPLFKLLKKKELPDRMFRDSWQLLEVQDDE